MDNVTEYHIAGADVLMVSILVLFLGAFITKKLRFLQHYNIPAAVTGGLICSLIIALIYVFANVQVTFDMRIRNVLLLIFFSTVGLSAKFRLLAEGGKALVILVLISAIFLIVQDVTGVLLAKMLGAHPGYGLLGGSISFAGGHGTAIAWGERAQAAGLEFANEIGMACATFGLIAGGIIGGPIAERLIQKHKLRTDVAAEVAPKKLEDNRAVTMNEFLGTILLLAICVELGDLVNRLLFHQGIILPGFLTAMIVGVILTNTADLLKLNVSQLAVERCNEFTLPLFLAMSLMSMQLWSLVVAAGPILLLLIAQVTVMTVFAVFVVFRVMGRDYDASVIAAGFAGLGLGATPVALANMNAVTSKYGHSLKAFLVIPLVGAFFIDLLNAVVIKMFIALPMISKFSL